MEIQWWLTESSLTFIFLKCWLAPEYNTVGQNSNLLMKRRKYSIVVGDLQTYSKVIKVVNNLFIIKTLELIWLIENERMR